MKLFGFFIGLILFGSCSFSNVPEIVKADFKFSEAVCENGYLNTMDQKLKSIDGIEKVVVVNSENIIKIRFNSSKVSENYIKRQMESFNGGNNYKVTASKITKTMAANEINKWQKSHSLVIEDENDDPTQVSFPSIFGLFFVR